MEDAEQPSPSKPEAPHRALVEFSRVKSNNPGMSIAGPWEKVKRVLGLLQWRHGENASIRDVIESSVASGERVEKP